ncbi:MAG TPA: hypothetical protein VK591_07360 [Xanthobacteraceae bacterium]|nr:hypothetical protein [Xanthobacteraceae bacterium]
MAADKAADESQREANEAEGLLREAVKHPKSKAKLAAAKNHPMLKDFLSDATQEDMLMLNNVAKGGGLVKCTNA